MKIEVLPATKCARCKFKWIPRTKKPKKCPRCQSRKWRDK